MGQQGDHNACSPFSASPFTHLLRRTLVRLEVVVIACDLHDLHDLIRFIHCILLTAEPLSATRMTILHHLPYQFVPSSRQGVHASFFLPSW